MLEINNTEVYGWEAAIRGMRNPLESHSKSDSYCHEGNFIMGSNDLKLAARLSKAGSDHGKFLRYITVTCDITAPLYYFKEFDTYKVGTVANSTSTMHKIMSKQFTEDMFSWEDNYLVDWKQITLERLNDLRADYLKDKSKRIWKCLIQTLPDAYNQTRTVLLNYQVLKNMYNARKNHKLSEWHTFCEWIESLPYAKELILCE